MPDIKTKEEILNIVCDADFSNHWQNSNGIDYFDGHASSVLKAMDIYSKQQCIEFLDYVMSYQYRELEDGATSSELYNLYLEQSKQK